MTGHSKAILSVAINPDGESLASTSRDGTLKVWNLRNGEWWEVLGVDQEAHPQVVKYAYRRLARQYHSDINRSTRAIAKMQAINNAYEAFLEKLGKGSVVVDQVLNTSSGNIMFLGKILMPTSTQRV